MKQLNLNNLLAALLTIVALLAGQQAFATITETITFKGKEYNGYSYQIESHWFDSTYGPAIGNSHTFSDAHFNGVYDNITFDMTLNGTLQFQSIDTSTDVMTIGGSFTVTLNGSSQTPIWFYDADVKKLDSGKTMLAASSAVMEAVVSPTLTTKEASPTARIL